MPEQDNFCIISTGAVFDISAVMKLPENITSAVQRLYDTYLFRQNPF